MYVVSATAPDKHMFKMNRLTYSHALDNSYKQLKTAYIIDHRS